MNIFIAFANQDRDVRDKLLRQMNLVKDRQGWNIWSAKEIKAGERWGEEIEQRLRDSELVILLLSADFFASDYIMGKELPEVVEKHRQGNCQIIPVLARQCHWKDTPFGEYAELGDIQALPVGEKPIISRGYWDNEDQPYFEVVEGIKDSIKAFQAKKREKLETAEREQLALDKQKKEDALAAEAHRMQEAQHEREAIERQKEEKERLRQAELEAREHTERERREAEQRTREEQARHEQEADVMRRRNEQVRREKEEHERLTQRQREQEDAYRRADQNSWQQAADAHNTDTYQSYLAQFPQGEMAREARFRIKELKRQEAVPVSWGRYAVISGGVLAVFVLVWLSAKWLGNRDGVTQSHSATTADSTQLLENVPSFTFNYPTVRVAGGTFQMGSPASEEGRYDDECQHEVPVGSFFMGNYEVTQAQWKAVMGTNPSYNKNCDDCPVEQVSWNDVQSFIKTLNQKTGKTYRLPTEAEWEYAAKGGNASRKTKYSGSDKLGSVAWYDANSGSKTHAVGGKSPNELGLYDMSGNVREWCQDNWKPYPGCSGTTSGRVYRGGSWSDYALICRAALRNNNEQPGRGTLGFRLCSDSLQ